MADRDDGFTDDTTELAQCAQINFDNCEKMIPGLKDHPMWRISRLQFNAVVERFEAYDKADQI